MPRRERNSNSETSCRCWCCARRFSCASLLAKFGIPGYATLGIGIALPLMMLALGFGMLNNARAPRAAAPGLLTASPWRC